MKYVAIILLVALVIAGSIAGYYRNRASSLEAEKEQAALDAVRAKRAHEEADTKAAQEIIQWKANAARHEADARRARASAAAAAKNVKAVVIAGERLQDAKPDEILDRLRAQGIRAEWCRP